MKMKKIIIAIATVLLAQMLPAQESDAVYKLLRQEWTVNNDGTSDYHYRHEVQILRNRALTAYADKGETFVVYNPDLEELTVNEVYTVRPDGSRVEMPQNAFVYQLPSECADCGRFNHFRELAMVHTGMELGCTVVVDYTIHRRFDLVNQTLCLVKDCPVEQMEINVTLPDNQELNVKLNDPALFAFKPEVAQTAHRYSLKVRNLPGRYTDSYLPRTEALYPMLHFFNGIPEFVPAFDENGLPEAARATGKAMSGTGSRENLVLLRNYVIDNIHLNDIAPEMLGYKHSTAAEVWQSGCGTATDKAVLLAAILNQWGYRARVVGDQSDEVAVVLDTLEYRMGMRQKSPLTLYGEAKDEVRTFTANSTEEATLDTLEDGFFQVVLPGVPGGPNVSASRLALTRTAPVQSAACNLKSDLTLTLPKGVKLVGPKVDEQLSFEGVGSVKVSIKQSGSKLKVVRNLQLEESVVPANHYEQYRRLLTVWQGVENVLVRKK